jgi:acylphosphatase
MSAVVRRVVIRGRVQGVGYRAWTEHAALQRGLEGWVRNRTDGTVEAVFAGPLPVVEAMIEACRRGPRSAQVEELDQREGSVDDITLRRRGETFSLLPTA